MKTALLRSLAASFGLALAVSNVAFASRESVAMQVSPTGVEYASAGIGDDQQDAMKKVRKDFNLQLTFARPMSGEYVIDVKVVVENAKHEKLLDVVASGPMLFAILPAGKYKVTADADGQPQTKIAAISKGHPRSLMFYFDERN